jgi:histone chaperone ASF1
MAAINITNVTVLENPASVTSPFQFQIQYECLLDLADGKHW